MARTALTKTTGTGHYPSAPAVVTMAAADATDFNNFTAGGNDIIIARNSGAGSHNITLYGPADPYGRTATIAYAIGAGAIVVYGPLPILPWQQTDGKINIDADHAEVLLGVVAL